MGIAKWRQERTDATRRTFQIVAVEPLADRDRHRAMVTVRIEAEQEQSCPMAAPPSRTKRARLIAEERKHTVRWFYLSFATDTAFLGSAIVRAHGIETAKQRASELNANPGGEVMCVALTRKNMKRIPVDIRNRLLNEQGVRVRLEGKSVNE